MTSSLRHNRRKFGFLRNLADQNYKSLETFLTVKNDK